jgi:ABC-type polysaccharide/polyol phosphate export permease
MMVLGVIGARMRDLEHLMSTVIRFLFFATPIFWIPGEGTLRSIVALVNPLAWFLDLLRLPLLNETPSIQIFMLCIIVTALSVIGAFVVHRQYGRFVPTWL